MVFRSRRKETKLYFRKVDMTVGPPRRCARVNLHSGRGGGSPQRKSNRFQRSAQGPGEARGEEEEGTDRSCLPYVAGVYSPPFSSSTTFSTPMVDSASSTARRRSGAPGTSPRRVTTG